MRCRRCSPRTACAGACSTRPTSRWRTVSSAAATRLRAAGFAVLRAGASPPPGASRQLRRALRLVKALRERGAGPRRRAAGRRSRRPRRRQRPQGAVAAARSWAARRPRPGPPRHRRCCPGRRRCSVSYRVATELAAYADGSVTVSVIFPAEHRGRQHRGLDRRRPGATPATAGPSSSARSTSPSPGGRRTWPTDPPLARAHVRDPAGGHARRAADGLGARPSRSRKAPTNDLVWRRAAMTSLGFPGDSPPPETAYGDAVRRANGDRLGVHGVRRRQPP